MTALPVRRLAQLEQRAARLAAALRGLEVRDRVSAARAAVRLRALALWRRRVRAWFAPLKDQARRLHRELCQREQAVLAPVEAAEAVLRRRLAAWWLEQRRQQVAQAAAATRAARRTQQRLARLVGAEAAAVPAVVAPAAPVTLEGVSVRQSWSWRPAGDARAAVAALVAAAADRPELVAFLRLDEAAITAYVRARGAQAALPGIEVFCTATAVVRTD